MKNQCSRSSTRQPREPILLLLLQTVLTYCLFAALLGSPTHGRVKIATINALTVDSYVPRTLALERVRGIEAAVLEANNNGGIHGELIDFKPFDDDYDRTLKRQQDVIADVMAWNATALVMQGLLSEAAMVLVPGADEIPSFTPWSLRTTSYEQRSKVHMRVPFESEMNNMMHFGMNSRMRCKQFVIGYGIFPLLTAIAKRANETLVRLGLPPARLVMLPGVADTEHAVQETKLVEAIYDHSPIGQCIVFWNGDSIFSAINRIVAHPKYDKDNMFFFGPSISAFPNMSVFGPMENFANLYFTLPTPGPEETKYTVVRNFHAAYKTLEVANTSYTSLIPYAKTYAAFEAYVGTRLLIEALLRAYPNHHNQTVLLDAVYRTRYFNIDDFTLGPYRDGCNGAETGDLTACWCNVGVKQLFTARVNGSTGVVEPVQDDLDLGEKHIANPLISLTECSFAAHALESPHVIIVPSSNDIAAHTYTAKRLLKTLSKSFAGSLVAGKNFGAAQLDTTAAAFGVQEAAQLVDRYAVNIVAFPAIASSSSSSSATSSAFIGSLDHRGDLFSVLAPLANDDGEFFALEVFGSGASMKENGGEETQGEWNPSIVSFWPTLADYVHTAMSYAEEVQLDPILVTTVQELVQPARDSATTFGVSLDVEFLHDPAAVVNLKTTDKSAIVVATQVPDLLASAFEFAFANPNRTVVLCTSDLVLSRLIVTAPRFRTVLELVSQNNNDGLPYLLFATGISTFNDEDVFETYTTMIREMVSAVAALLPPTFSSSEFIQSLYTTSSIGTQHATIGPFDKTACDDVKHPSPYCQCSKGLLHFYIHRVDSIIEMSSAFPSSGNNQHVAGAAEPIHSHFHEKCGISYNLESTSLGIDRDLVVTLLIVVVVVALVSFTAVKLVRNSTNTPIRTLIRSRLWTTGMRIVFQSLDILTDLVACFIVLTSNSSSIVFAILFSILTLMALAANVVEIRTVILYYFYLLEGITTSTTADQQGSNEDEEEDDPQQQQHVIDREEEAEVRKEWKEKLGYSAAFTLIFEDIPMVTMTSVAIASNPEQPFLFVSLVLSAALMGSKVINLRDVLLMWLRDRWTLFDDQQLEHVTRELHPSLSLCGLQHALTSTSHPNEIEIVRGTLDFALHESVRLQELNDASSQLESVILDMNITPTEYYAYVQGTLNGVMDEMVNLVEKNLHFSREETFGALQEVVDKAAAQNNPLESSIAEYDVNSPVKVEEEGTVTTTTTTTTGGDMTSSTTTKDSCNATMASDEGSNTCSSGTGPESRHVHFHPSSS